MVIRAAHALRSDHNITGLTVCQNLHSARSTNWNKIKVVLRCKNPDQTGQVYNPILPQQNSLPEFIQWWMSYNQDQSNPILPLQKCGNQNVVTNQIVLEWYLPEYFLSRRSTRIWTQIRLDRYIYKRKHLQAKICWPEYCPVFHVPIITLVFF